MSHLVPVVGGILVGGASRRMGRPKQLVRFQGRTLVEHAAGVLTDCLGEVVLLGSGPVPSSLEGFARLPDVAGLEGPAAGILAALRVRRGVAWLVVGCDQPLVSAGTVEWLLAQRGRDRAAVIPRSPDGPPQPLLACYEPAALPLLESSLAHGHWGPRHIAGHAAVWCPTLPPELAESVRDVDSSAELEELQRRSGDTAGLGS
jgi:molybdopterin-guanine dinucleotide biosynthesis protein A